MYSLVVGGIVFACTFGGAILGGFLRERLPAHHLNKKSRTVIKMATGLIGSVAALVLGLLIASASTDFSAQRTGIEQLATNLVLLDRALAHYGPEAKPARAALRRTVARAVERAKAAGRTRPTEQGSAELTASGDSLYDEVRDLAPTTEGQRSVQSQALTICADLARTRWELSHTGDSSIPRPFLVVLVFWLSILFVSFGLFSPPNATVVAAFFVCALSVGGAVFLIVDMDQPFEGLIHVSGVPIEVALAQFGQ
jgi:hypothetical protein